MILNSAQDVIYNGRTVYGVYANGVKVWPPVLQTYNVECYGQSNIAIGMTATRYGEVIFTRYPLTSNFTASAIPAGTRIQCVMITPTGYTASAYRTGLLVSSISRSTSTSSTSASSYVTFFNFTGDSKISAGGYGLNAFTASGAYLPMSNSSEYFTNMMPAYIISAKYPFDSYVSAHLTAQREMYYRDGGTPGYSSIKYFNPKLRYSAVKVSAYMSSTLSKSNRTTNSVTISSTMFNGSTLSGFSNQMGATQTGSVSQSGSSTKSFNGTSFNPSSNASSNSNLYTYRDISTTYSTDYSSLRGYTTAYWTASGILA